MAAMTLPEANMSLERTTAALSSASFVEAVPWVGTTIMKGPPYTIWRGDANDKGKIRGAGNLPHT